MGKGEDTGQVAPPKKRSTVLDCVICALDYAYHNATVADLGGTKGDGQWVVCCRRFLEHLLGACKHTHIIHVLVADLGDEKCLPFWM